MLVSIKAREGASVLARLRQEGCLKTRLPRPVEPGWCDVVTINSSGGVAQGDWLEAEFTAEPGARVTVASQAAERYYRSPGGDPARVQTHLHVAEGAALEWLPQETILFAECALHRSLTVSLADDSHFLALETLVFGRTASGETVHTARLRDTIRIYRAGALLWHDAIRVEGPVQAVLDRAAVAGGRRAVATLVFASPAAAAMLDPLRAALAPFEAGASVLDGLLVARVVAADGACARAAIVAGLALLRGGRALPRVWSC